MKEENTNVLSLHWRPKLGLSLRNNLGWFVAGAEVAANGVFHQSLGHQRIVDEQADLAAGLVDHVIGVVLLGQSEAEFAGEIALVEVDVDEVDSTSVKLRLVVEALELRGDVLRALVAIGHDDGRQTRLQNQTVDIGHCDVVDQRFDLEEAGHFSAQTIAGDGMNRNFNSTLEVFDRANRQRVVVDEQEIGTVIPGDILGDVAPGLGILGLVEAIELDGAGVTMAVAGEQFELGGLSAAAFFARIGDDDGLVTLLEQELFGVAVGQFIELENGFDVGQLRSRARIALSRIGSGSFAATCKHDGRCNDEAQSGVFES